MIALHLKLYSNNACVPPPTLHPQIQSAFSQTPVSCSFPPWKYCLLQSPPTRELSLKIEQESNNSFSVFIYTGISEQQLTSINVYSYKWYIIITTNVCYLFIYSKPEEFQFLIVFCLFGTNCSTNCVVTAITSAPTNIFLCRVPTAIKVCISRHERFAAEG